MANVTAKSSVRMRPDAHASGRVLILVGVVGGLDEVVLYFWPDQVPERVFSNPFGTTGFIISQIFFFVHHAVLALGVAALAARLWRQSLATRVGGVIATTGAALWTVTELVAIPFAAAPADEVHRGLVGTMFGMGCTLVGLGMIVIGSASLRNGRRRVGWAACSVGFAEFLILTPGIVSDVNLLQHLAIAVWILLFAALGAALMREPT